MDNFGYLDNSGMGVYTAGTQFDFDPIMLKSIGFTDQEINMLNMIVMNYGKVTVQSLVNYYGFDYEEARKLKYMYDICTGRVVISSPDDLSKHLRKMFGKHRRIGIGDLEVSHVTEIPRTALVAGIPSNTPFAIWNSKQYPVAERMYTVISAGSSNVTIETSRKPILKYGEAKSIDGILSIDELTKDGKVRVTINKKYCRLCNRFAISASLRRPEFHLGMVEIICIEGTRVYVFADTVLAKKYNRYGSTTQRVYDYGFYPFEIQPKLMNSASKIYQKLCGVYAMPYQGNSDFVLLEPEKPDTPEEDEIEIE